jgi:hypothetical protein
VTVTRFQQKRGTSAEWAARTTPLLDGEIGVDKDTGVIKMGDGFTLWADLPAIMESEYLPILGKAKDSYRLDGLASTDFLRSDGKAVDSDKLDGLDSTAFLRATAKAVDSDLLDGLDSTAFLRATAKAVDSDLLDGNDSTYFATAAALSSAISTVNAALPGYRRVATGRALTANGTLALGDEGTLVSFNAGSLVSFTIPLNSAVAFPIGGWVDIQTINQAGVVSIAPAAGVTVQNQVGSFTFKCVNPYSVTRLLKTGTDTWVVLGTRDTGWITIPTINGYGMGAEGSNWRFLNDVVLFQIHVQTATNAASAVLYNFPVGARPAWNHWWMGTYAQVYKGELKVTAADGNMTFANANTQFVVSGSFPVR